MIQTKEVKIEVADWQKIVDTAKAAIKDALINLNIWTNTLRMAESKLKEAEAEAVGGKELKEEIKKNKKDQAKENAINNTAD